MGEMIETVLSGSPKGPPITTPPLPSTPSRRHRKSISSSVASIGSLLSRAHQATFTQPTTEGRIRLKHTVDCGSEVLCCRWSSDGSMLGAALRSGEIRMLTPTGQTSFIIQPPASNVMASSDQQRKSSEKSISFRKFQPPETGESKTRKLLDNLILEYLPTPVATSVLWHPDDNKTVISSYSDGQVLSWELPGGGVPPKTPKASKCGLGIDVKLAAVPGGQDDAFIAYTSSNVVLRNIDTLNPIIELQSHRPPGCLLRDAGAIWTVVGKGKDVIGGGHSLIWWDSRSGEIKKQVGGTHIRGSSLSIHPTANRMVTGSAEGSNESVKVWETTSGKVTHTLFSESYQTNVKSTSWAGRDLLAVGGSDPHVIRLVNLDNVTLGGIKGLKSSITWLDTYIARGHQTSKLAAASGTFIYLIDLPK